MSADDKTTTPPPDPAPPHEGEVREIVERWAGVNPWVHERGDAVFDRAIAAAPTDVATLIALLTAREAEIATLRAEVEARIPAGEHVRAVREASILVAYDAWDAGARHARALTEAVRYGGSVMAPDRDEAIPAILATRTSGALDSDRTRAATGGGER